MKNSLILFILLIAFNPIKLYSQAFTQLNNGAQGASINFQLAPEESNIEGSPYYSDIWKNAIILRKDSSKLSMEEMNYNTHINQMVFKLNGGLFVMPKDENITRIELNEDTFFLFKTTDKDLDYYREIISGNWLSLISKYNCLIQKGEPSKGYTPGTKDKYIQKENFFLKMPNKNLVDFNLKKSDKIFDYMGDKKDEMYDYQKSNNLKMKKLDDLHKMIKYYNHLCSLDY